MMNNNLGQYIIRPIQANLTHDTEWLGKMDPYCSYRVGPTRIKGPVCRNGGKFPKWEDATVSLPAANEPSIVVDLLDKDKFLFDDVIGSFVIDLNEIQSRGQVSKWYPVWWRQRPAGEILLEAAYQAPVQQQVLVKQTVVEQPVIIEKVIKEEIIPVPEVITTTQTQPQFQSGTVIQGVSQIHHGGQGIGLVPNAQGTVIGQGTTLNQGTLGQGTILNQGGQFTGTSHLPTDVYQGTPFHESTYEGGHLHHHHHHGSQLGQGNLGQGNLGQGSFGQGNLGQGNLGQGNLGQGNLGQGNLGQGNLGQGTYQA